MSRRAADPRFADENACAFRLKRWSKIDIWGLMQRLHLEEPRSST